MVQVTANDILVLIMCVGMFVRAIGAHTILLEILNLTQVLLYEQ